MYRVSNRRWVSSPPNSYKSSCSSVTHHRQLQPPLWTPPDQVPSGRAGITFSNSPCSSAIWTGTDQPPPANNPIRLVRRVTGAPLQLKIDKMQTEMSVNRWAYETPPNPGVLLTGRAVLLRVEHLLQVADLIEQLRGRVLRIEETLAACIANYLLVDHHVGVDAGAVVACRLIASHVVVVVPANCGSNLPHQTIPQHGQKLHRTCGALGILTILQYAHQFPVNHFERPRHDILRLARQTVELKFVTVNIQICRLHKHGLVKVFIPARRKKANSIST